MSSDYLNTITPHGYIGQYPVLWHLNKLINIYISIQMGFIFKAKPPKGMWVVNVYTWYTWWFSNPMNYVLEETTAKRQKKGYITSKEMFVSRLTWLDFPEDKEFLDHFCCISLFFLSARGIVWFHFHNHHCVIKCHIAAKYTLIMKI